MAQRGRSARETQEEIEAYRDRLSREKSRLEMARRLRWPLLCLVLGVIIGVIIAALVFVLMSDRSKEWVDNLRNFDVADSDQGPSELFQPTPVDNLRNFDVADISSSSSVKGPPELFQPTPVEP